jgi:predicted Zn-dependent peptidase
MRMKRAGGARAAVVGLWLAAAPAGAQEVQLDVREHTLPNGMQVLLVPRRESPTVATYLRFKVGSVQEHNGITGIAHFLEHMMFKGTRRIGTRDYAAEAPLIERLEQLHADLDAEQAKGLAADRERLTRLKAEIAATTEAQRRYIISNELSDIYERNGGVGVNASTTHDGTQYSVQLPANKLELWAFLESDRIANPVFREFYPERDVVLEERRGRYDTSPVGKLYEVLRAVAYVAHPYRHPILGWASDIARYRPDQVREYFKTYYAPNNAVAVLVGDFDPAEALALITRYFGPIPPQPILPVPITAEPEQRGERRVTVEFDARPQVVIGYHAPAVGHPDTYPLSVLAAILGEGRTSRLYKGLVEGRGIALSANCYWGAQQHPGLFNILAVPREPRTTAEIERAVYEEIERIVKEPPTERELLRVRNQTDAELIQALDSNAGIAEEVGDAHALTGSWRYLLEARRRLKAVTAADVQRVARQYLIPSKRTVITLVPPAK